MSERNVTFTVKEGSGDRLFLSVEFYGPIRGAREAEVYFRLPRGVDIEKASEIARYLRENIADVQFGRIEK